MWLQTCLEYTFRNWAPVHYLWERMLTPYDRFCFQVWQIWISLTNMNKRTRDKQVASTELLKAAPCHFWKSCMSQIWQAWAAWWWLRSNFDEFHFVLQMPLGAKGCANTVSLPGAISKRKTAPMDLFGAAFGSLHNHNTRICIHFQVFATDNMSFTSLFVDPDQAWVSWLSLMPFCQKQQGCVCGNAVAPVRPSNSL